ncbi:MAG TPA: DUF177 domain-containing protein [Vicinamibacterales bacterium]|nr:DUF177 domain-containing protein [Vicinamibacterales bacterium]
MIALNLARIRTPDEHFEQLYAPAALGAENDVYTIAAPVSLVFDIHKDKDKFHLVGRVTTTLEMSCGRCLEPFSLDVDAPFDLRYQPHSADAHQGVKDKEIEADDLTTAFYANDEIDLGQLMEEQFYLAVPMKPLCKDDCKGLCPNCGTNLNKATCDCNTHWEDPRLAALRSLKKES